MQRQPRNFWPIGDDEWSPYPQFGAAQYVSSDRADKPPALLVPDGAGGYREHCPEPKRRPIGFR